MLSAVYSACMLACMEAPQSGCAWDKCEMSPFARYKFSANYRPLVSTQYLWYREQIVAGNALLKGRMPSQLDISTLCLSSSSGDILLSLYYCASHLLLGMHIAIRFIRQSWPAHSDLQPTARASTCIIITSLRVYCSVTRSRTVQPSVTARMNGTIKALARREYMLIYNGQ